MSRRVIRQLVLVAVVLGTAVGLPLLVRAAMLAALSSRAQPSTVVQTLCFLPEADTYVDARRPEKNFGLSTRLEADGKPAQISYVRFRVTGIDGMILSATLRLWVLNPSKSIGGTIVQVNDSGWSETELTFSSRPAVDERPVATLRAAEQDTWVEANVTQAVTGDGPVSLAITSMVEDGAGYASRERSDGPQLLVTVQTNQTVPGQSTTAGEVSGEADPCAMVR